MDLESEHRHPLDVVLQERGLSLAGLAALYRGELAQQGLRSGADRQLMWKWKAGHRTPTHESQQVLADVLGVSQDAVVMHGWPSWLWLATSDHDQMIGPPWSISGTMQVLRRVAGGRVNRVDRRTFLTVTGASLTSVAAQWALSLSTATPDITSTTGSRALRLTDDVLNRLDSRLGELRRLDDVFGGHELRHLAGAELGWLSNLADHATYGERAGQRLFALITEAARLCGWLHFDEEHHASAQAHYVTALRCSATANDPMAGAHVLACMSFQAMLNDHPQTAISLLDTAESRVGTAGSVRLKALIASRKARAFAILGDAKACGHELNLAEHHLDVADADHDAPDWIYYFDEAELNAQAGACWVSLSQPARARPLIDNALRTMGTTYVRDRTIYHVRSAQAYADASELEMACRELDSAVDLAEGTHSTRSIHTIRAGRIGLQHYDKDRRVRTLDRRLDRLAV